MASSFSAFVKRDSFMHRLNPSLKIIGMVFLIVLVFLPTGFIGQAILLVIVIALWMAAKLPWRKMSSILKSVLVMFVILFIVNWMVYKSPDMIGDVGAHANLIFGFGGHSGMTSVNLGEGGGSVWCAHGFLWGGSFYNNLTSTGNYILDHSGDYYVFKCDGGVFKGSGLDKFLQESHFSGSYLYEVVGTNKDHIVAIFYHSYWYSISSQVIIFSSYVTLKIFLMIVIVTLIISTTNPVQLSFAIEDILHPLRYLKAPVNEWSMTISIALRFVPSLLEESQRILKAQASRGVDFSNGNFRDKIKSLVSLVVPMFSIAFHKADDLANAMEARSYNPRYTRTRYRNYVINWFDWILFCALAILFGLFIYASAQKFLFEPFGWPEAILQYGG